MSVLTPLGENLYQLELIPYDKPDRTTGYLITDDKNVLIETGASPSVDNILQGLEELGLTPDQVDAIIVTHIHLDHSGGVGLFLTHCPNAKVYVHEKGVKHLVNPENLVKGARQVYRHKFESMFDPVMPVSRDNIVATRDGDRLRLNENRELIFHESPGHALHHIVIHDTGTNGIFTGDAAGAYYMDIKRESGRVICSPSAAPTQFDPAATEQTIEKMVSLDPDRLYFTHYGVSQDASACLSDLKKRIRFYHQECVTHYKNHQDLGLLKRYIVDWMNQEFDAMGISPENMDRRHLEFDSTLNAMGIIAYIQRLERK